MNNTNPTRYYINDLLTFSWTVKHAENGSYEDARDVIVSFYFTTFLAWKDIGAASGLTSPSTSIVAGRTVLTYTYGTNGGTLSQGNILLTLVLSK